MTWPIKQKYKIGESVKFRLDVKVDGQDFSKIVTAYIREIKACEGTESVWLAYGLTDDMCEPYHHGNEVRWWKCEEDLQK